MTGFADVIMLGAWSILGLICLAIWISNVVLLYREWRQWSVFASVASLIAATCSGRPKLIKSRL